MGPGHAHDEAESTGEGRAPCTGWSNWQSPPRGHRSRRHAQPPITSWQARSLREGVAARAREIAPRARAIQTHWSCQGRPCLTPHRRLRILEAVDRPGIGSLATRRALGEVHVAGREGTTLGPYTLTRALGSGGAGEVYLADGPAQGGAAGQVALKVLH